MSIFITVVKRITLNEYSFTLFLYYIIFSSFILFFNCCELPTPAFVMGKYINRNNELNKYSAYFKDCSTYLIPSPADFSSDLRASITLWWISAVLSCTLGSAVLPLLSFAPSTSEDFWDNCSWLVNFSCWRAYKINQTKQENIRTYKNMLF